MPPKYVTWLREKSGQFPDLAEMARVAEGFPGMPKAQFLASTPDIRFDLLAGEERLKSLELALVAARDRWDGGFTEGAFAWIREYGNQLELIADFESVGDGGSSFPDVWERFGWDHSPNPAQSAGANATGRNLPLEAARVLDLLNRLPNTTVRAAIGGLSQWLSAWEKFAILIEVGLTVWLKFWPIAVDATNEERREGDVELNTVIRSSSEPKDLDTLNTPVGKLVGVFLAACPTIQQGDRPFQQNAIQRHMRDVIESSIGHSGLIVKYRLIETLHYFVNADLSWTKEHLIAPLLTDTDDALALWRAVGRRTRFLEELKLIGEAMVDRATDLRLGRETRQSFVFSLVLDSLRSFQEGRPPAVPGTRIQQMLRSLDDEVRAFGAGTVQRFVEATSSGEQASQAPTREQVFRVAAKPFLQKIWPQERSLTTPGVSKALADLPASAGTAFADAVTVIERFLVPFDCWSMLDYGLYGDEGGKRKLARIDNEEKGTALLLLLDRTIGDTENAVIPMDLGDALDQVRKVAPTLVDSPTFRRLATFSRRV